MFRVLEERSQQMLLLLHLLQQLSQPSECYHLSLLCFSTLFCRALMNEYVLMNIFCADHQRNLRRELQSEIAWQNCWTGILVYCSKVVLTLFVGLRPCLVFIYQVYEFILAPLF
jgi:hypothetical protein